MDAEFRIISTKTVTNAWRFLASVINVAPNSIYTYINRICKANDLPEVGIHGLCHSFASLAFSLKMPEKVAMEIGGWANDQTMRRIYTHLAKEDLKKHAQSFTEFFKEEFPDD